MSVDLNRSQRDLLRAVGDDGDGWYADIMRVHPKHAATLTIFRHQGLVAFTTEDTRVRITEAGRKALEQPDV